MKTEKVIILVASSIAVWQFIKPDATVVDTTPATERGPVSVTPDLPVAGNAQSSSFTFPNDVLPSSVEREEVREYARLLIEAYPTFFAFLTPELVLGVVKVESNFNPRANGLAKEIGLMQVKYSTWAEMVRRYGDKVFSDKGFLLNPNNWKTQIMIGMLYLFDVSRTLQTQDWTIVLTGYNVGPTGYRKGRTNNGYVQRVLGWTGTFTPVVTLPTSNPIPPNAQDNAGFL